MQSSAGSLSQASGTREGLEGSNAWAETVACQAAAHHLRTGRKACLRVHSKKDQVIQQPWRLELKTKEQ